MKRLSLLALALAVAGPVSATDWTGWYVGGHVGYSSADLEASPTLGGAWSSEAAALRNEFAGGWSADLDPSGTSFGLNVGYDHGFSSGFLLGGELSYSRHNLDETRAVGPVPYSVAPSLTYTYGNGVEVDSTIALRAKLGYAGARNAIYGIIGAAQVDVDTAAAVVSNGNYRKAGGTSDRESALQYGVGYAYDFGNDWTLRAEFVRTDVGDLDFDTFYLPGSSFVTPAYTEAFEQDLTIDSLNVGVTYRF